MAPSLTSAVYFSIFLGGATYWSLNNTLECLVLSPFRRSDATRTQGPSIKPRRNGQDLSTLWFLYFCIIF
ncbi:hypothetical protein Anas_05511 [Armadillidium nasatum]|uniref:Uncharacterized protein n=1 Tax=Armadillidium nasatum TaxID=96803 RepID=A0A5N5SMC0_9CRUS|nr:hypothetical protein Anas_05511 [Armadillidium nasatum]